MTRPMSDCARGEDRTCSVDNQHLPDDAQLRRLHRAQSIATSRRPPPHSRSALFQSSAFSLSPLSGQEVMP